MAAEDQISQLARNIRNSLIPETRVPRFSSVQEMREFQRKTPLERFVSQIPERGREALDPRNFGTGGLAGVIRRVGPKKQLIQLSKQDLEDLIHTSSKKGRVQREGLSGERSVGFEEIPQSEELARFYSKLQTQDTNLSELVSRVRNAVRAVRGRDRGTNIRGRFGKETAVDMLRLQVNKLNPKVKAQLRQELRQRPKNREINTSDLFQDFDPLRNTDELID